MCHNPLKDVTSDGFVVGPKDFVVVGRPLYAHLTYSGKWELTDVHCPIFLPYGLFTILHCIIA